MKKRFGYTGMVVFFLLAACAPFDANLLLGKWKAVEIREEGKSLDVNLDEIQFQFTSSDTYTFNSTLNYREAGTYFLESKYLHTTDTVNQATTEKAVEILLLTADSLHLRMNDNGRERLLKLVKVN